MDEKLLLHRILFIFCAYFFHDSRSSVLADGRIPCETLAHSGRFTQQQLKIVCERLRDWEDLRDSKISKELGFILSPRQKAFLNFLERCSGNDCIEFRFATDDEDLITESPKKPDKMMIGEDWRCSHPEISWRPRFCSQETIAVTDEIRKSRLRRRKRRQSTQQQKAIRKEYRLLSDDERARLVSAMKRLKQGKVDGISKWDILTATHYPDNAPGAHWGPGFLLWHREFLRQFEVALRNEEPDVALPYWDSTLDHGLPDPRDSILWTDELFGNGDGYVTSGPAAGWSASVPLPGSDGKVNTLYRAVGAKSTASPMSPDDIDWVVGRKNFSQLTFCVDKTFESMHGMPHMWVGGYMYVIRVSPNDPTFHWHHAFVDSLWERFRQAKQTRQQRANDYVPDGKLCNAQHAINSAMTPYNKTNKDGLSNDYTDIWYEYRNVQHCNRTRPTCNSKFLFCDTTAWVCRSKVQPGGNCTGFAKQNKICIVPPIEEGSGESNDNEITTTASSWIGQRIWAKVMLIGQGGRAIEDQNAKIIVQGSDGKVQTVSRPMKSYNYPEFPGIAYISLRRPLMEDTVATAIVSAEDGYGRRCQAFCRSGNSEASPSQICDGKIKISDDAHLSSDIAFTHNVDAGRFLDADLSGHPATWKVAVPYMVFLCEHEHRPLIAAERAAEAAPDFLAASHVWFHILVLDRKQPFVEIVTEAQVEARDLDDPYSIYSTTVEDSRNGVYDPSVVFIRARNPYLIQGESGKSIGGVTVSVAVRTKEGIFCESKCMEKDGSLEPCLGHVFLHPNAELSHSFAFAPDDASSRNFLGWSMIGHPSKWSHRLSILHFYC